MWKAMRSAAGWAALATALALAGTAPGRAEGTHREGTPLGRAADTRIRALSSMTVTAAGNVVACDRAARAVLCISPDDRLVARWRLRFAPSVVGLGPDGSIYVGGEGAIAVIKGSEQRTRRVACLRGNEPRAITCSGRDVFVACDADQGSAIVRLPVSLRGGKRIVDGLSGCCGQMDIAWIGGALRVAENGRKRIVSYDRTGRRVGMWARDGDDSDIECFGGCCNPKNLAPGPAGSLYTCESETGRVKRFTLDGKLCAIVGTVQSPPGCVRVSVGGSADGSRVYVLDGDKMLVRVLKGPAVSARPDVVAP